MELSEKLIIIGKLCDLAERHPKIQSTIFLMIQDMFITYKKIPQEIINIGILEGKLHAVKELKAKGYSLMDAKHMLEDYFKTNGLEFKSF